LREEDNDGAACDGEPVQVSGFPDGTVSSTKAHNVLLTTIGSTEVADEMYTRRWRSNMVWSELWPSPAHQFAVFYAKCYRLLTSTTANANISSTLQRDKGFFLRIVGDLLGICAVDCKRLLQ